MYRESVAALSLPVATEADQLKPVKKEPKFAPATSMDPKNTAPAP